MITVHGTCVAFDGQAVLVRGPSGSGKSTLALELIETSGQGLGDQTLRAQLVSDDQTVIEDVDGTLWVSAPQSLQGQLEVRGLGILRLLPRDLISHRFAVPASPEEKREDMTNIHPSPLGKVPSVCEAEEVPLLRRKDLSLPLLAQWVPPSPGERGEGRASIHPSPLGKVPSVCEADEVPLRVPLVMVVDLVPSAERLPAPDQNTIIMGVKVPLLTFPPHAGALATRVRVGFSRLKSAVAGPDFEA